MWVAKSSSVIGVSLEVCFVGMGSIVRYLMIAWRACANELVVTLIGIGGCVVGRKSTES